MYAYLDEFKINLNVRWIFVRVLGRTKINIYSKFSQTFDEVLTIATP